MYIPNGYNIRLLQFIYYTVQIAWHKFKYSPIERDFFAAAAGLKWDAGLTGAKRGHGRKIDSASALEVNHCRSAHVHPRIA